MAGQGVLSWIQGKTSGDEKFARALDGQRDYVYRLALKMAARTDLAEDIAQTVLISAWQKRRELQDFNAIKGWLRTATVRHALNALARTKPTVELTEAMATSADSSDAIHVERTLSRLSPEHRAILALALGEQLSYTEIAETLSIPEGTVSSRLNSAKASFRKHWEGE